MRRDAPGWLAAGIGAIAGMLVTLAVLVGWCVVQAERELRGRP